jgi:CheY-like chemotaxis protein
MSEFNLLRRRNAAPVETKVYEIADEDSLPERKHILILEDEAAFAAVLKEGLEAQQYLVTVVSNGAGGLQRIMSSNFDAIVCDVVMPNFPGDMFYKAVERVRPHLCKRFIFMTGHQGDPKIAQFIRSVKGLALWKPFQLHVLLDTLKTVVSKN